MPFQFINYSKENLVSVRKLVVWMEKFSFEAFLKNDCEVYWGK